MCKPEIYFPKFLPAQRRLSPFERVDPIRFVMGQIFMGALEGGAQALSNKALELVEISSRGYEQ
jgi:hypothetical protein